jgi:hypothetical protein
MTTGVHGCRFVCLDCLDERFPQIRKDFEQWHLDTHVQEIERHEHTYKNAHVRGRWQGWLAAHGIKKEL